jgi:hypothetical protein
MIEVPCVVLVGGQTYVEKLIFNNSSSLTEMGDKVYSQYNDYTAYVALVDDQPTGQVDIFYQEVNPDWMSDLEKILRDNLE